MDKKKTELDSLFLAALEIEVAGERAAFLDRQCGENQQLRTEVEELLQSHKEAGNFLDRPAAGLEGTVQINREALDAGLSPTFGAEAAVVIGNHSHSVLQSLSKSLPEVPHVALHDSQEDRNAIVQPRSTELPGKLDDSRYQLLGEIARGGMGAIIKGRDTDLGRDLAIKVLLDSHKDKPEVIQRFVEEAQIGGQLQHPGIVPVYELGQFGDERPFFTMKLVKGKTLAALLEKRKDPSEDWPKLLGIFEQVCQTMAYTHSKGVIHRDLKPANIMVGAFGEVQVMDWGLSKVLREGGIADEKKSLDKHRDVSVIQTRRSTGSDSIGDVGSQTQMGSVMGTPAYMPPEQALGEVDRLDERADVFGLGAILAEILTGKPPYMAEDSTKVFRMASRGRLEDCFARLDASAAEPELIEIAKTALAPEPDDRMRDAGELSTGITQHSEGVQRRIKEAELARAEAQARSGEERRRKKLYLAIAGMMLILAVTTTAGAVLYKRQADTQMQLTQSQTERANEEKRGADEQNHLRKVAEELQRSAEDESRRSKAMRLAAESEKIRKGFPVQSALLAVESIETTRPIDGTVLPMATASLLNATIDLGGIPLHGHTDRVTLAVVSADGRWLLTGGADFTVRVWDLEKEDPSSAVRVLRGHGTEIYRNVRSIEITPDSHWAATGSVDGTARLWDLTAEDPSTTSLEFRGHDGSVNEVAISPDGRWLATGSADTTARLWDLTAADPSADWRELKGHEERVNTLAFSPDGHWLVTASNDKTARLWDVSGEEQIASAIVLHAHTGAVRCLSFSPDSRWLVTGSDDKTARLWDVGSEDPTTSSRILHEYLDEVSDVKVSPDGRWLATASADSTVRLWSIDADGPGQSSRLLTGHQSKVNHLGFSPNSRFLATVSYDHTARLWDLTVENPTTTVNVLRGHEDTVHNLAFRPGSRTLITVSWDKTVRLWDLTSPNPASDRVLRAHGGRIRAVAFSPDQRWLASGSDDSTIRLWDFTAPEHGKSSIVLHDYKALSYWGMHISSNSQWLAARTDRGDVQVWDLTSEDVLKSVRVLHGHTGLVYPIAFGPASRWIATGSQDGTARIWDLHAAEPSQSMIVLDVCDSRYKVNDVTLSADGQWLAVSTANGAVQLWDFPLLVSGRTGPKSNPLHRWEVGGSVNFVIFSPDNRYLVAPRASGAGMVWDLQSNDVDGSRRNLLGNRKAVIGAGITPDGRWFATAAWHPEVRLWDFRSVNPNPPVELRGHGNTLTSLAISTDGGRLVTGSEDNTARIWDLTTGNPARSQVVLRGHEDAVACVAISPDGRWVVTGSFDHTLRVWDLNLDAVVSRARRLTGRELTAEERETYWLDE